jgi:hypothetical protein
LEVLKAKAGRRFNSRRRQKKHSGANQSAFCFFFFLAPYLLPGDRRLMPEQQNSGASFLAPLFSPSELSPEER